VNRSRDVWRLQGLLGAETGVRVQVRWDHSASSEGWKWHVSWSDGPTLEAMCARAERLCRELVNLDAEGLHFERIVQPRSYALAMVRSVRLGQPPLGDHGSTHLLGLELDRANYPKQGAAEDVALAGVLVLLSHGLEHEMPALLDRTGLAGLRAELGRPDNVFPLRRPPR
jgi:hypothetical protein